MGSKIERSDKSRPQIAVRKIAGHINKGFCFLLFIRCNIISLYISRNNRKIAGTVAGRSIAKPCAPAIRLEIDCSFEFCVRFSVVAQLLELISVVQQLFNILAFVAIDVFGDVLRDIFYDVILLDYKLCKAMFAGTDFVRIIQNDIATALLTDKTDFCHVGLTSYKK